MAAALGEFPASWASHVNTEWLLDSHVNTKSGIRGSPLCGALGGVFVLLLANQGRLFAFGLLAERLGG